MEEKLIRGVNTRVWKHAPPTLRDVFLAGMVHGERVFLVHEEERASYRAFSRAALALAHALIEAGVRKSDRVAIAMRNLPEWPAAFFGALLAGAIATPLNAWWTGAELEYALKDSGAKIAFVDAERFERIVGHWPNCPQLERIYVCRHDLLHVRHHRPSQGRARHAPQFDVGHRCGRLFAGAGVRAAGRAAAPTRRADPLLPARRAVLPRHRLPGDHDPGAVPGCQARADASLGCRGRDAADRAGALHARRRRADRRLAADRASRAQQI